MEGFRRSSGGRKLPMRPHPVKPERSVRRPIPGVRHRPATPSGGGPGTLSRREIPRRGRPLEALPSPARDSGARRRPGHRRYGTGYSRRRSESPAAWQIQNPARHLHEQRATGDRPRAPSLLCGYFLPHVVGSCLEYDPETGRQTHRLAGRLFWNWFSQQMMTMSSPSDNSEPEIRLMDNL